MTGYVVPARVGVVTDGDDVYVAHLPQGPILSLTGTAALVWHAALNGPRSEIISRVADASGLEDESIAADVITFVEALAEQGLIAETKSGGY